MKLKQQVESRNHFKNGAEPKSQVETGKAVQAEQEATLSNSDIIALAQKKLPNV